MRAEHIGCVWGIRFPTWSPSALCSTKWLDKPVTGAVGHIVKQSSEQPPKYLVKLLFSFRGVSEVEVAADGIHADEFSVRCPEHGFSKALLTYHSIDTS
jgi:hypothetical protein